MTNHIAPSPNHSVALVTGASDRIGAAIATHLARAGHAVIVHYRSDADGARAVRSAIVKAGGRAAIVKADLARRSQRASLIERAAKPFGPLTVLVNNASVFDP